MLTRTTQDCWMDSNLECTNQDIDFKINENWSDSEILSNQAILNKLFGYYSRAQYQKQSKLQNNFIIHFDRRFGGDWVRIIGQCECRFGQWDHNQLQCQVNKSHLFFSCSPGCIPVFTHYPHLYYNAIYCIKLFL